MTTPTDPTSSVDPRRRLGDAGERRVADWYRRRGYRVVDRNWRSRNGELDLVVTKRGTLVFCEVKTRTSRRYGNPFEAVTEAKQKRIKGLAMQWLRANNAAGRRLRFDVAAVEGGSVEVREAAF